MPSDMKPGFSNSRHSIDEHSTLRPIAYTTGAEPDGQIGSSPMTVPPVPARTELNVNVTTAIVAVTHDEPVVLSTSSGGADALPSSRFQPARQANLDECLRDGVAEQTALRLGYAEQLLALHDDRSGLGIGYLALTRTTAGTSATAVWRSWYDYLPWEDWRNGRPAILAKTIEPVLRTWSEDPAGAADVTRGLTRAERTRMAFGLDRTPWNEERVADRFDLLCETGLVGSADLPGRSLRHDHARILASAIGRLRAKLKIRPVIFELMDNEFTLFELQKTVEAILGPHLHKQNFRRLIESAGLVEPTGEVRAKTGGRPAKLFRFRHEVLMERPAPGVRVHAQHG